MTHSLRPSILACIMVPIVALSACRGAPPDQIGSDRQVKADSIAFDRVVERTTFTQAVDTLARYCSANPRLNLASIQNALIGDGYVGTAKNTSDKAIVFEHPAGRPVISTSLAANKDPACYIFMPPNKVEIGVDVIEIEALIR